MNVTEQACLRKLNTFGVPARAALLIEVESEEEVLALPALRPDRDLVLGGGSNVLFVSDVPGTVVLNRIRGIDVIERTDEHVFVEVGAGENWHDLVMHATDQGWHGLENLALIPGLAGAAPIQNIGAYGVELASVLDSVTAWDREQAQWAVLATHECRLGYRDSRFKAKPERFLITSIRLRLQRRFEPQIGYAGLGEALRAAGAGDHPTASQVRDAVIGLRRRKLPDPALEGNAGSFFKNPVVPPDTAEGLRRDHADLPGWPQPDGRIKLPAAWLIEHCGLKGETTGGAAVSDRHALVLVNRHQATGRDVWALARRVIARVEERYGIHLEPEPRIFGHRTGADEPSGQDAA
ncbi:UDP-N-acetylmuramate dehydrogenase [Elongatibacter sediminis]|uniref:UDP-N-acetylenolpyruvoylglucosamine reductase n=1 Tax=Elongatibacter sediminis TaxID=3119006 RepID=A0AAW9R5B8_9GAMM